MKINKTFLIGILHWIFPYFETITANKKVSKKMETLKANLEENEAELSNYMKGFEGIKVEEAKSIFDSIIFNRKSLEEKARVNVLIVTIAVTVILGLSNFLFAMQDNISDNYYIKMFISILFILSLINLISGSITSLATLNAGETKEIYSMSPEDYKYVATLTHQDEKNKELVYLYSRYSELNIIINLKINNYLSCSYANIRNAIFMLGIIGTLFCFIFIINKDEKSIQLENKLNTQIELLEKIDQELSIIQNKLQTNDSNIDYLIRKQNNVIEEISDINKTILEIKN